VEGPNQVWCADINYLPMRRGFLYLVAIMDWSTRKVLAWRISNTLEANFCVEALNEAIHKFSAPEIMNTDQSSQFTSFAWTDRLRRIGTRISTDGKGRCLDNIFIERLWRSLKYECVYMHAWETDSQAKAGIGTWIAFCNHQLPTYCPWRSTARRSLLQHHRNRPAGAGSRLHHSEICPRVGK
jgi:putative transposase